MAPEMFASKPYDEAVDVYSFGVILCQMIGRVDADPDVMERWSTTLSVNMESFVRTHAPSDTPAGLLDLAFACTCLSDDERLPLLCDLEVIIDLLQFSSLLCLACLCAYESVIVLITTEHTKIATELKVTIFSWKIGLEKARCA